MNKNLFLIVFTAILITNNSFGISIVDDAFTVPHNQCAPYKRDNYGQFCLQNVSSQSIPITLQRITWDGCSDNQLDMTLNGGQAYNTSWGTVPFSTNCRLQEIRIQIQDSTHYVYTIRFNNLLVPQYGAMQCTVSPINQSNSDRKTFATCSTIDRDLNIIKYTPTSIN